MKIIAVVLKILLMLGAVFIMMLPLLLEYLSYKRDCETGISHKRFRLTVFSLLYSIAITVTLIFINDIIAMISSWQWVSWIVNKLAVPRRLVYGAEVTAVMIINLVIGILFKMLLTPLRIGLKKLELIKPKKKGEKYSLRQRIIRKILKRFNNEKWFFAKLILKFLCPSLILIYSVVFLFYLAPVVFGNDWIPYDFIKRMFEAGYIYPVISLIPLCEAYFFLSGVENLEKECPELEKSLNEDELLPEEPDISTVDKECRELFKYHFAREIKKGPVGNDVASTGYHEVTTQIAKAVEHNSRDPRSVREGYLQCLNTIVINDVGPEDAPATKEAKGVIVGGSFFSDFADYFLRFVSVVLARGDNVIFVCNDDLQINQTFEFLQQTFIRIYSLYQTEKVKPDFDNPVWKIEKISGKNSLTASSVTVNNCSVLVTDLNFLTAPCFEEQCDTFVHLTDTVVFVDTLRSVNNFAYQMSVFDTKMKNMRELNAIRSKKNKENDGKKVNTKDSDNFGVRYTASQIKYICFDDSKVPGIDKVLKNLLFVDFISADSMHYVPQTVVCCYNYEPRKNENGEREQVRIAKTNEDLSVLLNMADCAVRCGSGKVSLFAEQTIPLSDLTESVDANTNQGVTIRSKGTNPNLYVNSYQNNLDYCRVIVAFDYSDNLPMIVRKFRTLTSDKKTLIMIFSRPYMFRDYYTDKIDDIWQDEQMLRIPEAHTGKQSAIRKILVKANSGGISDQEILDTIADADPDGYAEIRKNRDIIGLLRKLLTDCGKQDYEAFNWTDYFEFVPFNDFNNNGEFCVEERVCLRNKRVLSELLDSSSPALAVIDGKEYPMTVPKNRIMQNYIVSQNLLYDGCVYVISAIDLERGKIYIKHATGGLNTVPYSYIQNREYHIDCSDREPELIYPTKHVELDNEGKMAVKEVYISVSRRPMEVVTRGYYAVDRRTLALNATDSDGYYNIDDGKQVEKFHQTYRKYGDVKNPVYSSDTIMKSNVTYGAFPDGALVMSVKLKGKFCEDNSRILLLASVMLNEVLRTLFPTAADAVSVCPVMDPNIFKDEEALKILKRIPKAYCRDYNADPNDIEILIIEDCSSDLGVISAIATSGDSVHKMLFKPVYDYLEWYINSDEKSDYLNFGMDTLPDCFDVDNLYKLVSPFGDDGFKMRFADIENARLYDVCDFCGRRFIKGTDVVVKDGRKICRDCASALVAYNKKELNAYLERAKIYLESTYGITFGDDYEFCFESTVEIANALRKTGGVLKRGTDAPFKAYIDDKKKVHVEYSIPSVNLAELLVRELTHVWQLKHLPEVNEDLAEGHIALVDIQYLRFLNQNSLASVRTTYYESTRSISGTGYRKLVKALIENPQYNNNPFRYLLEFSGGESEKIIIPPTPRVIGTGDYGLTYVPENFDRVLDGNIEYFYRSRLTVTHQAAYDILLNAISNHEHSVCVEGCTFDDVSRIAESVEYDHPELFWYRSFSMAGSEVTLIYGATAEESAVLQRRIDESVAKYLSNIDDTMSAYDAALRIHVKLISSVDYDTIMLNKEKSEGGPANDKIDYLRSICGVFINGKAVCEGYARAMQYLLQKCGIECAESAGHIKAENGDKKGGHAWNILKIDGDYYYLDTTWDDSSNTVQTVKNNDLGFDYFCITTEELTRTRYLDMNPLDNPVCTATRANYYYHNDLVLETYDLEKIKTIAKTAAKNKGKSFTFKCKSRAVFEEALEKLFSGNDGRSVLNAAERADKTIESYTYLFDKNIWTITVKFKYK